MSAKTTILLIRHAETDSAGTFCGHSDPPINEYGQVQIQQLVIQLRQHRLDAVYCSDLQRALITAQAVAKSSDASLHVTPDLREINFGDWESSTWEEIERRDPAFAQRWVDEFPRLAAPNGEAFDRFEERTLREFDVIAASELNAAIVSHAGVLRVVMTNRCGLSDEQAWLQTKTYCGVFVFSAGGQS